mgnify:CR=1 FL=1
MADRKITDLTEISATSADDVLHLIDFNPNARNTKITLANFFSFIPANVTFGSASSPCNLTIYGSSVNANQQFVTANDTHIFNVNTSFQQAVSIGDATLNPQVIVNHYGYNNLTGYMNAAAANVEIGVTGAGNGKKLEVYGDTGHLKTDGDQHVEISGRLHVIANSVMVGNSTVGQDIQAMGADGVATDYMWWKKMTSTLEVAKPAQLIANTTGALFVDGATQLGNDTTGSDVKIVGSSGNSIYFDSATNGLNASIVDTTWMGTWAFGTGASSSDVTFNGTTGNMVWDASASKLINQNETSMLGMLEMGTSGGTSNPLLRVWGSTGAKGLFVNGTNDTVVANVADSDGFTINGSFVIGADGTSGANVSWFTDTAGESLTFDGDLREMTFTSTSQDGFIMNSNTTIGSAASGGAGFHHYGPGKFRFDAVPLIVGNSSVVTSSLSNAGANDIKGAIVLQQISSGSGLPDGTVIGNATGLQTQAYLYARLDGGDAAVHVMDATGTETKISSHTNDDQKDYEIADSAIIGGKKRHRRINMIKLAKALEEVTGEKLLEEWYD